MNERITQLGYNCWVLGSTGYHFDRGMFAKLIVEECAQRAEAYAYMSENFTALAEELRRMIEYEDSAYPLCGFDGGTQCGMLNCQY